MYGAGAIIDWTKILPRTVFKALVGGPLAKVSMISRIPKNCVAGFLSVFNEKCETGNSDLHDEAYLADQKAGNSIWGTTKPSATVMVSPLISGVDPEAKPGSKEEAYIWQSMKQRNVTPFSTQRWSESSLPNAYQKWVVSSYNCYNCYNCLLGMFL